MGIDAPSSGRAAVAKPSTFRRPGWLTDAVALDLVYLGVIVLLALAIRVTDLSQIPNGLHGDEAATGLDARRILGDDAERAINGDRVWPYTGSALGQPAGPMYWATPFVKVLGSTILAVRLPSALLGAGTIILGFFAARLFFGRPAAYAFAALLAFSSWLLFYNRIGVSASAMPFTEMASLLAVGLALHKRRWPWFVGAGFVVGAGIYGYYAYPLFAIGLAIFVVAHAVIERPRPLAQHARNVLVMGLTALLVTQPMWTWLTSEEGGYRHDRTLFAVSNTPEYKAASSFGERFELYVDNAQTLAETLLWDGQVDFTDGTGAAPALDGAAIVLGVCGLLVCGTLAVRRRRAAYLLPFIMIPVLLIGPVWSAGGYHRRALALLPFVLMAGAVALGLLWERSPGGDRWPWLGSALLAAVLVVYGWVNVDRYFGTISESPLMEAAQNPDLTDAALYIRGLPETTRVYFLYDLAPPNYDTVRYLVPGRRAGEGTLEDRAQEFGAATTGVGNIDRSVDATIVLLGKYRALEQEVAAMYPGARRVPGLRHDGGVAYIAFEIPAQ